MLAHLDGAVQLIDLVVHEEVRVVLGEPIPTEGMTRRDVPALQAQVERWIAGELERVGPLEPA